MYKLSFKSGSLIIDCESQDIDALNTYLKWDDRINVWRARADHYRSIVMILRENNSEFEDLCPDYKPIDITMDSTLELRDYQNEALGKWEEGGKQGVIVLPTGVGKSIVGAAAIARTKRPALVVLPTIDLMQQWASMLEKMFQQPIGMLGGGSRDVQDITVSTYDSAVIMMEYIGNRFGFLICDECHHLPGAVNRTLAEMSIAPFRMGLSATPERDDGMEEVIFDLLGPEVYRRDIKEFSTDTLSAYEVVRIEVELEEDEQETYDLNREIYRAFLSKYNIRFTGPQSWNRFIQQCARMPDGKEAMKAYMTQKKISTSCRQKMLAIEGLLKTHAGERIIIFTQYNDLA
ncbi:MAG: DEAD/DEAH box helicase, partial [Lentisphaeria bacterium]|nr:DEAD/DEAH box helicase [Lentisphaeria bacterium]